MTIIYVLENNCQNLAVTFKNNGIVKVQRLINVSTDKNILYEVKPFESFIGKSQLCNMTKFSGSEDRKVFDGNTILLYIGVENNKYKYVYIGGDQLCSFLTNDKIYNYISNMGNNLTPYSIAFGYENIYYLTPYFKYTKNASINNDFDKLFDNSKISNYEKIITYEIYSNHE